jgi:hypothetical protein
MCQELKLFFSFVVVFVVVYSCCSRLEHRASVKHFVSLQFLNLRQSVGLGRVVSPLQGRYLTQTDIHASSGIRTDDPSVRVSEDSHALERSATVIGFFIIASRFNGDTC